MTTGLWAQEAGAVASSSSSTINDFVMNNVILILGSLVALAAFFAIIYVNNQLMQLQKIRLLQEHGIQVMEEVKLISKEPQWKQWYKRMTQVVPIEKEEDILLNHNYDGIQELDNSLPPWWVAMFYITIAFGVVYFGYYHFTDYGQSSQEWYESEVAQAEEAVKAYLASQSDLVDETNVEMLQDESAIALGESIFQANCVACHGQFGEGTVGPNLTDKYWIHGGDIKDVFRTIKYGVPEKGMISWKAQLRSGDMHKVASYIMTLVGTNPPNGKAPEGEPYEDNGENDEVQDSTASPQMGQLLNN